MAFLGIERCLPLLHGSQGCTAFALVLMVRHFREAIPLQTTAMSELSTILGGADNVEAGDRQHLRARQAAADRHLLDGADRDPRRGHGGRPARRCASAIPEWRDLDVVFASTPDYGGSLEEGWGKAVTAIIEALVPEGSAARTLAPGQPAAGQPPDARRRRGACAT